LSAIDYNTWVDEDKYMLEMARMHKLQPKLDVIDVLRQEFEELKSNPSYKPEYILGCKAMAIFGACLLVSPIVIYGAFPYPEQAQAGAAMVAMCVASDATIIPLWLRRFFGKKA
jgi:hypothetical protein